jgi:hypothetical protein
MAPTPNLGLAAVIVTHCHIDADNGRAWQCGLQRATASTNEDERLHGKTAGPPSLYLPGL